MSRDALISTSLGRPSDNGSGWAMWFARTSGTAAKLTQTLEKCLHMGLALQLRLKPCLCQAKVPRLASRMMRGTWPSAPYYPSRHPASRQPCAWGHRDEPASLSSEYSHVTEPSRDHRGKARMAQQNNELIKGFLFKPLWGQCVTWQ